MPSTSIAQQQLMGAAHAAQQGKANPTGAAKRIALSMKPKDVADFASTSHKGLPQHVEGEVLNERKKNDVEFYTVLMPEDHTSKVSDLVKHHTPIDFCNAVNNGEFTMNEIEGFYMDQAEATAAAQNFVKGLYETAKGLEEKKEKVATALQKKIDKMHKEAQAAMNLARKEPENADAHRSHSQALLEKIKAWEMKHKSVSSAKKELQPLEEFETPKKKK